MGTREQTLKLKKFVTAAVLFGVMIAMWLMPFIGYITLPFTTISITLMPIPVIIGAIVLGPSYGAFLGGVFGVTSFLTCFGLPAPDPLGVVLLNTNPIYTAILCIVPRLLMGLLVGLVFKLFTKFRITRNWFSYFTASLAGPVLNTVLFVTALIALFFNTGALSSLGESVPAIIAVLVTTNAAIEAIVCTALAFIISKVVAKFAIKM